MTQAFVYPSSIDSGTPTLVADSMPLATTINDAPPALTPEPALHQIQNRLFNLSTQIEHMQAQLEALAADTQTSGDSVLVLTRHLTDSQSLQTVYEQIAELSAQLVDNQDQVLALTQAVQQTARQEQLDRLTQTVAGREQLEKIAQSLAALASQEQVERLLQSAADRNQVNELEETLKKLTRTQFKTNTLGESKEQQVTNALTTLQDLATRREQSQESRLQRNSQQIDLARSDARAEFAADWLPALDSLEMALASGEHLLDSQRTQAEAMTHAHNAYLAEMSAYVTTQQQSPLATPAPAGFWQRLFGGTPETPTLEPVGPPHPPEDALQDVFDDAQTAIRAWLQGLELVRERFLALLAGEGIQPIDALDKPFDPRLHVAVEIATRADVAPNTVVQVLRQGYRQRNRILRYAEVVVARAE